MRRTILKELLPLCVVLLPACGGGGRPNYSQQTTPPEVAWDTTPPVYTVSPSLTVSVKATDTTMGVGNVFVLVGSQQTAASQQSDGTWQAAIALPVQGQNIVTVWAEDKASPTPNSGRGRGTPYELTVTVTYSPAPPSVTYDGTFTSYSDERGLQLVADANGIAKMPAQYTVGAKVPVVLGADVYKAVTRLSGGTMSAAELESTNAANVPVLRFAVVHNVNTDPPITAATFSADVTCSSCPAYAIATGALLPSAYTDASHAYYDLPLAAETIPALPQITSTALVSVSVSITDATGATTIVPGFNVNFHLVGPPLAIVEDPQYAAALKPESTYAYRISDNSYSDMWNAAWWNNNEGVSRNYVRLLRYIVTNPAPVQVAIQPSFVQASGGSWRAAETWTWVSGTEPNTSWIIDGMSFSKALSRGGNGTSGCPTRGAGLPSCAYVNGLVWFHQNSSSTQYACAANLPTAVTSGGSESGTYSTSDAGVQGYRIATELGGQERDANRDSTGQWFLAPAASGGTVGTLLVYVTRPVAATRSRPADSTVWGYDVWQYTGTNSPSKGCSYSNYSAFRYNSALTSAQDELFGTLTASTSSYSDSTGAVGDSVQRLSVTVSRTPLATH
jgi:hypothetical protein